MFVKKLLNFRAVVFFVVIGVSLFLNGGMTRAEAVCSFNPDKKQLINTYCQTKKVDQAIKAATNYFTDSDGVVSCDFAVSNPSGGGYVFENSCAAKAMQKNWDYKNLGTPYARRALCGWENVLNAMNNVDFNNMSSCEAASGGECSLDEVWAEKICNNLTIDNCESDHNKNTHGCKLVTDMKNACYCNSIANPSEFVFENGNVVTNQGKQMTKDYCVDFPFSQIGKFSKCVWYDDDVEVVSGIRDVSKTDLKDNGCWCVEKDTTNEIKYTLYNQADCMSWVVSSPDPLSVCKWKENGNIIEQKTIGSKADTINGCYCTGSTSTEPSFFNVLEKAKSDFTTNDHYYFGQWKLDSSPEGQTQKPCVGIVNYGSAATCAWVETGKIIEKKTGNLKKKGCYCNTKENTSILEINWKKTGSMENCLASSETQYNPKCEWWDNGITVSSSTNFDVLYKKPTVELETPKTPKTPGITVEELKNLASKELNPMKFAVGKQGVLDLIGRAVKALMYAMGSILFALYIYAGILWMTSSGSSEKVGMAKKIVVWSTLGVIVQLSAYMIVSIVFKFTGSN